MDQKQALEELMGEPFIEWLLEFIGHEMQAWPQILAIRSAFSKPEKIKKFMLQAFLADEAFLGHLEGDPGFLRFAIANLSESDDPVAESALEILEKKRQEELEGHKIEHGVLVTAHREHWMKLLKALGTTEEEIERAEPKEATRNYIAELSDLFSASEWQTTVGAFAAYDRAASEEYSAIAIMLKNNFPGTENGLDTKYNLSSAHILDKVVFDPETKHLVWQGVTRQLEVRQEFLLSLMKYLEA